MSPKNEANSVDQLVGSWRFPSRDLDSPVCRGREGAAAVEQMPVPLKLVQFLHWNTIFHDFSGIFWVFPACEAELYWLEEARGLARQQYLTPYFEPQFQVTPLLGISAAAAATTLRKLTWQQTLDISPSPAHFTPSSTASWSPGSAPGPQTWGCSVQSLLSSCKPVIVWPDMLLSAKW